jgi:hypothetical protein
MEELGDKCKIVFVRLLKDHLEKIEGLSVEKLD